VWSYAWLLRKFNPDKNYFLFLSLHTRIIFALTRAIFLSLKFYFIWMSILISILSNEIELIEWKLFRGEVPIELKDTQRHSFLKHSLRRKMSAKKVAESELDVYVFFHFIIALFYKWGVTKSCIDRSYLDDLRILAFSPCVFLDIIEFHIKLCATRIQTRKKFLHMHVVWNYFRDI